MIDRDRILAKIDELDVYLRELRQIAPSTFEEYQRLEIRRACERLLQIAIESVIDICGLIVAGLRLGLPGEEDDLFEKLERAGVISGAMGRELRLMKGFRNLLVHEYGRIDDRMVFAAVRDRLGDFDSFKQVALRVLT